ncbi:MAG: hypothetical protein ACI4II_03495 [Acutalibacteraceae bacterium]
MKKFLVLLLALSMMSFVGCAGFGDGGNASGNGEGSDVNTNASVDADYEKRLKESEDFIKDFTEYLNTTESFALSAEQVADKYDNVRSAEVVDGSGSNTYRVYWVSGEATLYGNLEKEWIFVQWKEGDTVHAKAAVEQSGQKAVAAVVSGNKIAILSYDNMYAQKYIAVSIFEVESSDVKPININNSLSADGFTISTESNNAYISSDMLVELTYEVNADGFIIKDNNDTLNLKFNGSLSVGRSE